MIYIDIYIALCLGDNNYHLRTLYGSLLQTLQLSQQPDVAGPGRGQLQVLLLQPPAAGPLRRVEMSGPWQMFEKLSCKVMAETIIICVFTSIRTFAVTMFTITLN